MAKNHGKKDPRLEWRRKWCFTRIALGVMIDDRLSWNANGEYGTEEGNQIAYKIGMVASIVFRLFKSFPQGYRQFKRCLKMMF